MEFVDTGNSLWVLLFVGNWKGHWCLRSLLPDLLNDAQLRGHRGHIVGDSERGTIDLPGMIMADRKTKVFKIDTFELEIPISDFSFYYHELKLGPKRTFASGQEYYKMHGGYHCLVLNPEQRDKLLEVMEEMVEDVQAEAAEEAEEFSRRIQKINEKGVKVVSPRDPDSMKGVAKKVFVSAPNNEKN